MDKVIIITGPTAVGKTKLSIEIAKELNTEIINGDAYQIYKDMNIGTAKPTSNELKQVKHHLIDYLNPQDEFNVCDYQQIVRKKINDFNKNNLIPLIVGGSGLYIESVICDYTFDGITRDDHFEKKYESYSNQELYDLLISINKENATNIHPNNRKRVLRALELSLNNQTKGTNKKELLYDTLVLFLNDERSILYERINNRVDQMIENGLFDEVKSFYPDKLSKTSKAAIGYKELFEYFDGLITKEEAIGKMKQASRNYAKRQLTWFRNKPYVTIVDINPNNLDETKNLLLTKINQFLIK